MTDRPNAWKDLLGDRLKTRILPDGETVELVERVEPKAVKAYDADSRVVTVTASDGSVDRYGDIVEPDGWDVGAFLRNPVILVDHYYAVSSIVGVGMNPRTADGQFLLDIQLDPVEENRTAAMVDARLRSGSLRAVSVGFRPLETPKKRVDEDGEWTGGYVFTRQELLEVSWVAIPANPNATARELLAPAGPNHEAPGETDLVRITNTLRLAEIASRFDEGGRS